MFAALMCVSALVLAVYYATASREDAAFSALSQQVRRQEPAAPETLSPSRASDGAEKSIAESVPALPEEPLAEYAPLYRQNPDLFGWVRIEETAVDYPVMHTPDEPEYYLHRAFDKTQSQSGVPFLDANCFTGCGNYLIYGHHMNSGAMFASLLSYEKEAYWREHPVIRFDTVFERGEYTVLAAFYSQVYPQSAQDVFRYYRYTDLTRQEDFEEYLSQVKAAALYDTGISAAWGDELVTLSTCAYHTENGRFVVVAKKAAPGR